VLQKRRKRGKNEDSSSMIPLGIARKKGGAFGGVSVRDCEGKTSYEEKRKKDKAYLLDESRISW